MVRETTDQIMRELGKEELLLLRLVLEGWRDGAVAEHLGVSRPAVVQRRRRLGERLGTYLEPLESSLGERVSEELAYRLAHHG
jgi:DNA-binding NarL/FixJ family response regulator